MDLRRSTRGEEGVVAITVALLLIGFLAFTALAVDYGYLAYIQRKLQTAADAAALAGAQEIIYKGLDQAAIYSKVKEYAQENGVPETELQSVEIASDGVKVSVSRNVGLFFARAIGVGNDARIAKAKAKVVWISGLNDLVPFGVVDVRPDEIWAGFDGKLVKLADLDNDSIFNGSVGAPLSDGSHAVIAKTVDKDAPANGVTVDPAAAVLVGPTPVKWVTLGANPSPSSGFLSARVAIEATVMPDAVALVVGTKHTLSYGGVDGSGNRVYQGAFAAPASAGTYPADVEIRRGGAASETVGPVAYLRVVDGYSVIGEVKATPTSAQAGFPISLSVKVNGFEYGQEYSLKLTSDPYGGNFMALALDDESGGNAFRVNISEGSTYEYFIGDIVVTEPGNMQGPTNQGLNNRILSDTHNWTTWSPTKPPCPRVITVPLVALTGYLDSNGRHKTVITGFARFFIESWSSKGTIRGYFVEYPEVGKGWTDKDPGDPLRPKTVRLVPAN